MSSQLPLKGAADPFYNNRSSSGPFVYGFIDLFSGYGESWPWGIELEENHAVNPSVQSQSLNGSKHGYEVLENKIHQKLKPTMIQEVKQVPKLASVKNLDTLEEECEDDSKNLSATDSSRSLSGESAGAGSIDEAKSDGEEESCSSSCIAARRGALPQLVEGHVLANLKDCDSGDLGPCATRRGTNAKGSIPDSMASMPADTGCGYKFCLKWRWEQ
ncbi:non-specific serine,threonine protein kinase [Sarracenia purpurea var. burkii]